MKTIAIIPARQGSKRIKSKNIKFLGDKPLICYTIESALASKNIDKVILSTDIVNIEEIIKEYKNDKLCIHWRNEHLCGDLISTEDVLIHILEKEKSDITAVVTLLPTSPFRATKTIDECIEKFYEKNADSVLTLGQDKLKIGTYCEYSQEFSLVNKNTPAEMHKVKLTSFDNPAVYVTKPDVLFKNKFILGEKTFGVIIDKLSGLDINDEIDWAVAEVLLEKGLINV